MPPIINIEQLDTILAEGKPKQIEYPTILRNLGIIAGLSIPELTTSSRSEKIQVNGLRSYRVANDARLIYEIQGQAINMLMISSHDRLKRASIY